MKYLYFCVTLETFFDINIFYFNTLLRYILAQNLFMRKESNSFLARGLYAEKYEIDGIFMK